jgi:hypothetical protein
VNRCDLIARALLAFGDKDPVRHDVIFHDEDGAFRKLAFGTALFVFDAGNVITPHAHRNMVSAHMAVEGELRVRNFDRIRDENGAAIIKPTRDAIILQGEVSTMSAARDNVHGFVPRTARATTLDVIVDGARRRQAALCERAGRSGARRGTA